MSRGCTDASPQHEMSEVHAQVHEAFQRFGELSEKFDAAVARVRAIDQPVTTFCYYVEHLRDETPPRYELQEEVQEENSPDDIRSSFKPQPSEQFAPLAVQTFLKIPEIDLDPKSLDDLVQLRAGVANVVDFYKQVGAWGPPAPAELQKCGDNVQRALDCVLQLEQLLKPSGSVLEQKQQELRELNAQLRKICQPGDVFFAPKIPDSLCLAGVPAAAKRALESWLPGKAKRLRLLWRMTRDGRTPQAFHARCDNQGPTLTVVRSSGGFVFGGFTYSSWQSQGNYTQDGVAWLFTLTNPTGRAPAKFNVQNAGQAIYLNSGYMPTFGGGHDLVVSPNAGCSYTNFPHGYTDTTGLGDALFTGSRNFEPDEVEVFAVA